MTRAYLSELLELASTIVDLTDAEGQLGKQDWEKAKALHDGLEARFNQLRNQYVDEALKESDNGSHAYDSVAAEVFRIRDGCDPSWIPAVDYTSSNLLPYLYTQSNRGPGMRKAIKALPWALGLAALIAYFSVRLFSNTPIDHAPLTVAGIKERATAIEKVIRYDDWIGTRAGRIGKIRSILLWPIKPTDKEVKGASEFAALALGARQVSVETFGCDAFPRSANDNSSRQEIEYLSKSANYLSDPSRRWKNPALLTMLDAARKVGRC